MKLIVCPLCQDVRKLIRSLRDTCECEKCVGRVKTECDCGSSWGYYKEDGLHAVIGGDAIPLGFTNRSFLEAIWYRPTSGMGSRFDAFVIPIYCDTVEREY